MRLEYTQNLRLEQRLVQSPQMIQAMQVLQLTTPELLDRIDAELEDNPFLESGTEQEELAGDELENEPDREEASLEEAFDLDEPLLEAFRGEGPVGRASNSEEEFDALQQVAAPESGGTDGIMSELRIRDIDAEEIEHAGLLLAQLDERGFLPQGLQPMANMIDVPVEELEEALEDLREVSHPSLGAIDLRECYLLQLEALPGAHELAEAVVQTHFEELLTNKLPQIADSLEVDLAEVRQAIEVLADLDSRPISGFGDDTGALILPDVIVHEKNGKYEVVLTREGLPELRLSKAARDMLEKAKGDKRMHSFLMKKLERARWFLDAVNHRRESLLRISTAIVDRQRDFLDHGPEKMRPLKMQEIADSVGVHISTVSRAIRGKFGQTPQGILPLKAFFSGGQRTSRGGQRSRVAIQERIKAIVDAEDSSSPLSDEEIVRILRERDGIKVARRTITKYRKALGIPASTMRRSY
ncbi:MAG: RNA polymerase factor sigma-54 [Planctomycetes bacterium]|nr:RNA polymerase factor sigma-54 [Planctomycetota bacterium]